MQAPRNLRLTSLAAFATIVLAVSAFAPAKEAPVSPRFNHVMLVVSNLDSSITFYTAAFDLQVAQRITELSVTGANGAASDRRRRPRVRLRTTSTSASTSATSPQPPSACGKQEGGMRRPSRLSLWPVDSSRRTR